jgi:hypothetical protein
MHPDFDIRCKPAVSDGICWTGVSSIMRAVAHAEESDLPNRVFPASHHVTTALAIDRSLLVKRRCPVQRAKLAGLASV